MKKGNMKKITLSTFLIISTFVLAGCNKNPDQALKTEKEVPTQQASQEETTQEKTGSKHDFVGSLKDLVGMGKAQKCTWESQKEGRGVVYVSGDKTRSEVTLKLLAGDDAPQIKQMMSISDGEYAYSWDPQAKTGMKIKLDDQKIDSETASKMKEADYMSDSENIDSENSKYEETMAKDYQYQCEAWKADESKFIPPTDIKFTDMNAMVQQTKQNAGKMKEVCNMLSGADKEKCLQGFEGK